MVDRPAVHSFKLVKDSEGTKRNIVDILHGINICTYFNDIWHFFCCWIFDTKSHLKRFMCMRSENFYF